MVTIPTWLGQCKALVPVHLAKTSGTNGTVQDEELWTLRGYLFTQPAEYPHRICLSVCGFSDHGWWTQCHLLIEIKYGTIMVRGQNIRVGHIDEDLDTGGERLAAEDMIRFVSGSLSSDEGEQWDGDEEEWDDERGGYFGHRDVDEFFITYHPIGTLLTKYFPSKFIVVATQQEVDEFVNLAPVLLDLGGEEEGPEIVTQHQAAITVQRAWRHRVDMKLLKSVWAAWSELCVRPGGRTHARLMLRNS
jgi:hypothetical protein